ncbi:MAG: helix-hairpin-helix domain-containing protein [Bacteroidales bacterium]|nr:helix-hairpin-helix domain-containing protein [Bacteroidales bacterium]
MKTFWKDGRPSASFVVGAVALLFLIIGYQSALFIRKASVARIVANHDHPDTVYVFDDSVSSDGRPSAKARKNGHSTDLKYRQAAEEIRRANTPRRYESFRFDPNTASIDDLMRLGFSQKQAQSIDNYRKKGGRFRRKADFANSYVVEDSVFRRLEEYIDIPKIDINKADSALFETLPGIGKYFASKMVSYREELGGYSYPEQLMDIRHFDREKFDNLKDLITVSSSEPYQLWTLPEKELAKHPYIGKAAAHGIVLFRNNSPVSDWTVENLVRNGVLDNEKGEKLARCRISPPDH